MYIVPLYEPDPADIEAPRAMLSPGGYDWWRLLAISDDGSTHLTVEFFAGCPFDADYVAQYVSYRRRPTRVRPPVARPSLRVLMQQPGEKPLYLNVASGVGETGVDSPAEAEIFCVGANKLSRPSSGTWQVDLTGNADGDRYRGSFTFSGAAGAVDAQLGDAQSLGGMHRWQTVTPACSVEGALQKGKHTITLRGRGCYVRRFGTSPLPVFASRWSWGIAVAGERVASWEIVRAAASRRSELVAIDASTAEETTPRGRVIEVDGPAEISSAIDGLGALKLSQKPRLQDGVAILSGHGEWDGVRATSREMFAAIRRPVRAIFLPPIDVVKH